MWHDYAQYEAVRAKASYPIDADLKRDLQSGWLLFYLGEIESKLWGRWNYWSRIVEEGELPPEPIPQISFDRHARFGQGAAEKMFARCFKAVGEGGWSLPRSIEYVLDWALFGFGYTDELPEEPRKGASMALYQLFDLWPLLLWPYDTMGDIMAEAAIGKSQDFYPTPHELVEAMTRITMGERGENDLRLQTVCDPCVGTGRMLLHASNYSLRLYGQDISNLACKTTIFNGFLYAPWLSRPLDRFLSLPDDPIAETSRAETLSELPLPAPKINASGQLSLLDF